MKKNKIILLTLYILLLLSGCGKSKVVKSVEKKIDAIGDISQDSAPLIEEAENAYNALSDKDKKEVDNYEKLISAREEYDNLIPTIVSEKIKKAVDDPVKYTNEEIKVIITEYDSLSDEQKAKVTTKNTVNSLRNLDVDKVKECIEATAKINDDSSFEEAGAAYKKYKALNATEQRYVDIENVEKKYICNEFEKAAVGACLEIKKYLKSSESFSLIEIKVVDDRKGGTGQFLVKTKYSATNSFGARVDDDSLLPINPTSYTDEFLALSVLTTGKVELYDTISSKYYWDGTPVKMDTDKITYWIENYDSSFFK